MDSRQPDTETEPPADSEPTRVPVSSRERIATGLLVACLFTALLGGLAIVAISTPTSAGDNVALFYFEPREVEADPGETITVDVVMQTHGGYSGEGIGHVELGVDYDPDVMSVTEIERGPYLEGDTDDDAEIETETTIDETNGTAAISQHREPAGDGATGTESVARITLEVADDAPPTDATLTIVGSRTTLVTEVQQSTMVREGTVVVDGGGAGDGDENGGEGPADSDDSGDGDGGPDGVILADDQGTQNDSSDSSETGAENETVDPNTEATGEGAEDSTDDSIAGFGVLVAIGGIVLALALAIRSRAR